MAIVAYNWDDFNRAWRTVFSILPLLAGQVLYGYAYFKKRDSEMWKESTTPFLCLMILASMSLISQTYNLGGELADLLMVWAVLIIPILYLQRSLMAFLIYLVAITFVDLSANHADKHVVKELFRYCLLLIMLMPWIFIEFKVISEKLKMVISLALYISVFAVLMNLFNDGPEGNIRLFAAFFGCAFLAGKYFFRLEPDFISISAMAAAFFQGMYFAFRRANHPLYTYDYSYIFLVWGITGILMLASAVLFFLAVKKGLVINLLPSAIGIIVIISTLFLEYHAEVASKITGNIFVLLLGVSYLRYGLKQQKLLLANYGLLFIAALAIGHFFDSEITFLFKGIVFILVGCGFLVSNLFISRQIKASKYEE